MKNNIGVRLLCLVGIICLISFLNVGLYTLLDEFNRPYWYVDIVSWILSLIVYNKIFKEK